MTELVLHTWLPASDKPGVLQHRLLVSLTFKMNIIKNEAFAKKKKKKTACSKAVQMKPARKE
jgi:hypothetical protein